ncbi:hypothetical protein [Trichormus sp. NMC-1]|uniref:hypothetical protein n=1 Tax=Trichormus sp. NMC-1 TaxID=1853259 RepID=UPI0008DBFDBA|nr:hypothetical protein [Trichormus sp. NMC-1]
MYKDDPYYIDLPIDKKKEMYKELIALDNKAREERLEKHPVDITASDSVKLEQITEGTLIQHKYREEFTQKYNLTYEQVAGLQSEGYKEGW